MICVGVWSFLPPPIWKAENEHGWQLPHCASAAAIFIGWYFVSISPSLLPTNICSTITGSSTTTAIRAEWPNSDTSRPLRRYQADTASITSVPVTSEARITCT